MKFIIVGLLTASLMACGGKAKKSATPDNKTGTTETTDGMGGATYGGAKTLPAPAPTTGTEPGAGH